MYWSVFNRPFVKIPAHKSLIADDGPHRYASAAEFHYSFHPSSCETMVWEVPDVLSSSGPATVDIGFVTEPNELKIFDLPNHGVLCTIPSGLPCVLLLIASSFVSNKHGHLRREAYFALFEQ